MNRREWLRSLKPGDRVVSLHSAGDVALPGVVLDDPEVSWWALGVAVQFDGGRISHYGTVGGGFGGSTTFPKGSPAIIGDVSYIFPADCNVNDSIQLLQLRYAMSDEDVLTQMPSECIRELNEVLKKFSFSSKDKDDRIMARFRSVVIKNPPSPENA